MLHIVLGADEAVSAGFYARVCGVRDEESKGDTVALHSIQL